MYIHIIYIYTKESKYSRPAAGAVLEVTRFTDSQRMSSRSQRWPRHGARVLHRAAPRPPRAPRATQTALIDQSAHLWNHFMKLQLNGNLRFKTMCAVEKGPWTPTVYRYDHDSSTLSRQKPENLLFSKTPQTHRMNGFVLAHLRFWFLCIHTFGTAAMDWRTCKESIV